MKKQDEDKLRSLFQEIELNEPSADFEEKLMLQIQDLIVERDKKRLWKQNVYMWLSIILSVVGMIATPLFVFYIMNSEIPKYSLNLPQIPPFLIMISASALLLLSADLFIRQRISQKKQNKNQQ